MGLSSTNDREETAMAEPWSSTVEKLTEFFATDQIEASARRTKFVQRASKITGKLFLALVTLGRWSTAKTTVPQLAAKAAQLDTPVDITRFCRKVSEPYHMLEYIIDNTTILCR